jgi:hypothetical protein
MTDFAYLGNLVLLCRTCSCSMTALEFPKEGKVLVSCHKYQCPENGKKFSALLPKIELSPLENG